MFPYKLPYILPGIILDIKMHTIKRSWKKRDIDKTK